MRVCKMKFQTVSCVSLFLKVQLGGKREVGLKKLLSVFFFNIENQ